VLFAVWTCPWCGAEFEFVELFPNDVGCWWPRKVGRGTIVQPDTIHLGTWD
jgi:hypothetical protein